MHILEKIDLLQNKVNHLRPFEGSLLKQVQDYYRIGITWSSNALEGNTLTESETKVLIEDGLTVGGKPLKDTFEALGHAKAFDFMFSLLGQNTICEADILKLHELFYSEIDPLYAGKYRDIPVLVSGSRYPVTEPAQIAAAMEQLCVWIAEQQNKLHPVEFAALLHKKFVFIHPFKDGNGRVARLLMNTALIQKGYLPVVIPPVLRSEYIELLEKAHRIDSPFIEFIAELEKEAQRELLRLLHIS